MTKVIILYFQKICLLTIFLGGRIESISKNIRVKLPEKDEEEVSNDEMEDDVRYLFVSIDLINYIID